MKIQLHDTIICRTPAFGVHQTLANSFEQLKVKIKTASPIFYALIAELDVNELHKLPEKAQFTLWKYLNRTKYRSTPYGSFAAITTLTVKETAEPIVINEAVTMYELCDWSKKTALVDTITASSARYFISNSTFYFVGEEIRYIIYQQGQFQLSSVASVPELAAILILCKHKSSKETIIKLMQTCFDFNENSTIALLDQLVTLQLILCDLHPNITGTDYFQRLAYHAPPEEESYITASRKLTRGNFDKDKLKKIAFFLNFASQHLPNPVNENIVNFKKEFSARFEQQEIPLALALDPEVGIGYGNLAQNFNANHLVSEIKNNITLNSTKRIAYTKLHRFLLNKMMLGREILLEDFIEAKLENSIAVPNTFSVLFELYKGSPVLYSAGGSSANALLGRFTMGDHSISMLCKTMVRIEEKANQDVLFFDIAYQAEQRVDNVNRRQQIYNYELPILTWSDHTAPLDLEDIMLSINNNEIVLRSKKLGKRLVPRLATAYNYNRSDLAGFRFLCDLQHQSITSSLNLNLPKIFPDLDFYPRVSCKGVIVSPAMWLYKNNSINFAKKKNGNEIVLLKAWLNQNNIDGLFKVGDTDQTLMFNAKNEEDLQMFLSYATQQNSDFYITEGLCDESDMVKDEHGAYYHPQYIASFFHEERVYQKITPTDKLRTKIETPGGEWLYFEIYTHSNQSDRLLRIIWENFIKPQKSKLKSWFFIRYFDPKPHLRLRLHLKDAKQGFELMHLLKAILKSDIESNLVNDVQLKTYYKELERYGAERIQLVEQFFCLDSELIVKEIRKQKNEASHFNFTLLHVLAMVKLTFEDITEQLSFAKNLATGFANEMNINYEGFKKINAYFKDLQLSAILTQMPKPYVKLFLKSIQSCENYNTRVRLLADLIHMHVNRCFTNDQRVYEAILYQYLSRVLQQQIYMSKKK